MEINHELVSHLADLSNLTISDQESASLEKDLRGIIDYISQLDELPTDGVEPTYQVSELENIWREDEILPQDADPDQLLALTKEVQNHQIKVPKVL